MATKASSTVERALLLLDVLAELGRGTVRELAVELGASSATTHRMLLSLRRAGLVEAHEAGGYQLGAHLFRLGTQVPVTARLRAAAAAPLRALSEELRLPAVLSCPDGDGVLYVMTTTVPGRRCPSRPGDVKSMHCTASGKVLLAFGDEVTRTGVLGGRLRRRTANTITCRQRLADEIDHVRCSGVGVDRGEYRSDLTAIAAPVHGPDGRVAAAVALCARTDATELSTLTRSVLRRRADTVSRALASTSPWAPDEPRPAAVT